jgi:hypothetical protein
MARKVTISSLGQAPPRFPSEEKFLDHNALTENMIAFWQRQINRVLPDKPDVIVLPEMCDRYNGVPQKEKLELRDAMGDRMVGVLREIARENHCYIVHSSALPEADGTWRNAAVMIDRSGNIAGQYNKNHTVVTEINNGILCGAQTPIIECDFGRVGFAICFDLNFDELRLKYQKLRPDLIIFPSMYHGGLMQAYWAYSCRAHFVGSIGLNNLPNEFYSPVGHRIASSTNYDQNITATLNLDCVVAHIDFNREKFARLKEKYGRDVTIFDPGELGSVLITSESETVSIQQMVAEFEIELLDDYFARSLAHQHDPANREAA